MEVSEGNSWLCANLFTGHFRFVNFGHPPPLLFSQERHKFMEVDRDRMVQFLPLGLEVQEDHPDPEQRVPSPRS